MLQESTEYNTITQQDNLMDFKLIGEKLQLKELNKILTMLRENIVPKRFEFMMRSESFLKTYRDLLTLCETCG